MATILLAFIPRFWNGSSLLENTKDCVNWYERELSKTGKGQMDRWMKSPGWLQKAIHAPMSDHVYSGLPWWNSCLFVLIARPSRKDWARNPEASSSCDVICSVKFQTSWQPGREEDDDVELLCRIVVIKKRRDDNCLSQKMSEGWVDRIEDPLVSLQKPLPPPWLLD